MVTLDPLLLQRIAGVMNQGLPDFLLGSFLVLVIVLESVGIWLKVPAIYQLGA